MKINNVNAQAHQYEWMVIRMVNGEFWYYGSWRSVYKAAAQAIEVNGIVIPSSMAE